VECVDDRDLELEGLARAHDLLLRAADDIHAALGDGNRGRAAHPAAVRILRLRDDRVAAVLLDGIRLEIDRELSVEIRLALAPRDERRPGGGAAPLLGLAGGVAEEPGEVLVRARVERVRAAEHGPAYRDVVGGAADGVAQRDRRPDRLAGQVGARLGLDVDQHDRLVERLHLECVLEGPAVEFGAQRVRAERRLTGEFQVVGEHSVGIGFELLVEEHRAAWIEHLHGHGQPGLGHVLAVGDTTHDGAQPDGLAAAIERAIRLQEDLGGVPERSARAGPGVRVREVARMRGVAGHDDAQPRQLLPRLTPHAVRARGPVQIAVEHVHLRAAHRLSGALVIDEHEPVCGRRLQDYGEVGDDCEERRGEFVVRGRHDVGAGCAEREGAVTFEQPVAGVVRDVPIPRVVRLDDVDVDLLDADQPAAPPHVLAGLDAVRLHAQRRNVAEPHRDRRFLVRAEGAADLGAEVLPLHLRENAARLGRLG